MKNKSSSLSSCQSWLISLEALVEVEARAHARFPH